MCPCSVGMQLTCATTLHRRHVHRSSEPMSSKHMQHSPPPAARPRLIAGGVRERNRRPLVPIILTALGQPANARTPITAMRVSLTILLQLYMRVPHDVPVLDEGVPHETSGLQEGIPHKPPSLDEGSPHECGRKGTCVWMHIPFVFHCQIVLERSIVKSFTY